MKIRGRKIRAPKGALTMKNALSPKGISYKGKKSIKLNKGWKAPKGGKKFKMPKV